MEPSHVNMERSLQELEGADWGTPKDDSSLITECHRLRRVPLKDFTAENLRMLIGQAIGLEYLIALALDVLEKDPWTEGTSYPGDLLKYIVRVRADFWSTHQHLALRLSSILSSIEQNWEFYQKEIRPAWIRNYS
ncbi:MAG: contact-dependent growth inhibition system immunity protein [Flavobacteriales bacterium]